MRIIPTLTTLAIAAVALAGCTAPTPTATAPTSTPTASTPAPIAQPTATSTPTATPTATPSPVAAPAPAPKATTAPAPVAQPQSQPLAISATATTYYYTPRVAVAPSVAAPVTAPQPVKVQTPAPVVAKPTQPAQPVLSYEQRVALCGKIAVPAKSPYCVGIITTKDTRVDTPASRQDALATLAKGWTTDLTSVELRETFRDTFLRSDSAAPVQLPGTVVVKSANTPNLWHTYKLDWRTAFKLTHK
jgi:hypothetical protein